MKSYTIITQAGDQREDNNIYAKQLHKKYESINSITRDSFLLSTNDTLEVIAEFLDTFTEQGDQYYIFEVVQDSDNIRFTNSTKHFFVDKILQN